MTSPTPLSSEGELFRKIMGAAWSGLHPDIQRRFEKNPPVHAPLKYTGVLEDLWCSLPGKILATLTYPMVRGALIPWRAKDFPVDIRVYSEPHQPGLLFKHRTYRLPGRQPVEFLSYMKESPRGEVLEYVGKGLGMKLKVFEKDGNLHFQSEGYFWDTGWFRIPLPG
ncbi:MAG: DUF4166 domain-containing protein, partial [Pseudomonadota bacterium]|nr:DUF4166 domain-containing protein [Pseudomonadota bacterium]